MSSPAVANRTMTRRNPLRITYTLTSQDYASLIARGLDPETIDESELAEHAQYVCQYNERDQLCRVEARSEKPTVFVYTEEDIWTEE